MDNINDKLKKAFEQVVEDGIKYDGLLSEIDYYSLFCKAAANDRLFRILGNNFCMFSCNYENYPGVLMIFAIPINTEEESGGKYVAERVMEVVKKVEDCFITLDHVESREVKEDKFVYVTVLKKIEEKGEDE